MEAKYYMLKSKKGFIHYISMNKEAAEKVAKEKKMQIIEIDKHKFMWLSIGLRPENIIP